MYSDIAALSLALAPAQLPRTARLFSVKLFIGEFVSVPSSCAQLSQSLPVPNQRCGELAASICNYQTLLSRQLLP